jgi:hypothetical protein
MPTRAGWPAHVALLQLQGCLPLLGDLALMVAVLTVLAVLEPCTGLGTVAAHAQHNGLCDLHWLRVGRCALAEMICCLKPLVVRRSNLAWWWKA